MGWKQNTAKIENLKCDWVNLCLEVKQGMRKHGIKSIPIVKDRDEEEDKEKPAIVGADSQAG